jgi:hypothetical protein
MAVVIDRRTELNGVMGTLFQCKNISSGQVDKLRIGSNNPRERSMSGLLRCMQ